MKKLYLILICILVTSISLLAQGIDFHIENYVPNPNFEEHGPNLLSWKLGLNKLKKWNKNGGTPDYHNSTANGFFSEPVVAYSPKSGQGYIGILSGREHFYDNSYREKYREYISVELKEKLVEGVEYKLQMSFRLSQGQLDVNTENFHGISDLGIVLSSNILAYSNGGEEVIEQTPHLKVDEVVINRNYWKTVSSKYIANGNEKYLTIGVFTEDPNYQLVDNNYNGNGMLSYIHIDDVSVSPVKICEHPCPPNLGELLYPPSNEISNACLVNIYPWHVKVSNVIEYELEVYYPQYGQAFYYSKGFNPNGFQNYDIIWNGNHSNGSVVPNGIYTYEVNLRNCHGSKKIQGNINVQLGNSDVLWSPNDIYGVPYNPDCCEDNIYYNNDELPQFSFAENLIQAINSEINSNQEVTFLADQIILKKGFHAKPNSKFHAKIEPCQMTDSGARLFSSTSILRTDLALEGLSIYPNPTHHSVKVMGSETGDYVITDFLGREVLSGKKMQIQMELDLSDLPNGVYIFSINGKSERIVKQ